MSETNLSGIYPVGYRVLVKPDPIEQKTAGGIVIPDSLKEGHDRAQATGQVIALGEFAFKEWPRHWASVGDRVLFAKYGGIHMIGEDGESYRLLNDEQITAKISDELNLSEFAQREKFT
jgi:chaperonin GroES